MAEPGPAPTLDLAAIEARAQAATPEPWVLDHNADGEAWLRFPAGGWISAEWRWEHDAEFASHARTDVPALVARVRELTAALAEIAQFPIETPIMPRTDMPPPLPTPQQVARSILRGEQP